MSDFTAYSVGLVYLSACSSLPVEEVERRANDEHPTGIGSDWKMADEPFKTGEANPCACHDHPSTHKHFLLAC